MSSSTWLEDSSTNTNSSAYVLHPSGHHESSHINGENILHKNVEEEALNHFNTHHNGNSFPHNCTESYLSSFTDDAFDGSGMSPDDTGVDWGGGSDMDVSWDLAFRDSCRFWVQHVFVPLVVIIGVMGNAVTIYILTRRPMRSSTNVYLTALAVSDLIFLLFSFSMSWRHYPSVNTIWFYWWYTPFGLWITDASSSTSVWLTVSFTIERYIAVCHPMRGKIYCTEERAIRVAIAVYLLCFAVTSSTPFEWRAAVVANQTGPSNETLYTLEITDFGMNETYRLVYHWFTTIFFVLLPVVILAIFNFFLIQAVRNSRIARKDMTNQQMSSVRQLQTIRQENRITIILIVVVIVFLICQMPTAIVLIYTSIHNAEHGSAEANILLGLGNIFNLLVAINASCNFLLYTALSDKYRKYFCAFFFCQRRKAPSNPRQFDGNPYELDTMDTTLSLSRGTSLRVDLHTVGNNRRCSYGTAATNGALRRTHTYNQTNGVRNNNNQNNRALQPPGGNVRKNIHISMKDPTIPLIQVDQV